MQTIKQARERLRMTQEDFAKAIGVTQGAVSQWETGLTHPAFDMLRRISTVLGISLDDLIGKEEESD